MRGVRESSGDVVYEGKRKNVEDDTIVVPTRCVTFCTRIVEVWDTCPTGTSHHCSAMVFHEQGTLMCTMCMSIDCQGYEVDFELKNKEREHNLEYQMRRPDGRPVQHLCCG